MRTSFEGRIQRAFCIDVPPVPERSIIARIDARRETAAAPGASLRRLGAAVLIGVLALFVFGQIVASTSPGAVHVPLPSPTIT